MTKNLIKKNMDPIKEAVQCIEDAKAILDSLNYPIDTRYLIKVKDSADEASYRLKDVFCIWDM